METSQSSLKIIKATISNFKNIGFKQIDIAGRTLIVSAKNAKGKSSVLQGILSPVNAKMIPVKPVKEGEDYGSNEIVIAGTLNGKEVSYTVGIHFDAVSNKGRLYLKDETGATVNSGKKQIIDMIIGEVGFDINDFIQSGLTAQGKPSIDGLRKQREVLESLIPNHILTEIYETDSDIKNEYEARTEVNRNVSSLKAKMSSSEFTQDEILKYEKELKVEDIISEREKAVENNDMFTKAEEFYDNYPYDLARIENEIAELNQKREALIEKKAQVDTFMKGKEKIELSVYDEKIKSISEHNQKHYQLQDYLQTEKKLKEQEELSNKMTKNLETLREKKKTLFLESNLPVKGLEINDDMITFEGLPLFEGQIPSSKLIDIGFDIGAALNPNLRVATIQDGSLLDKDTLDSIIKKAIEKDFQLIIEIVSNSEELELEFIESDL